MGMTASSNGSPMEKLARVMRQHGLVRFVEHYKEQFPTTHLKDMVVEEAGPNRTIVVDGHRVTNFGSDSFLGLDQDPRVQEAIVRGIEKWGTHNGASRAFSCVRANAEAEAKLAKDACKIGCMVLVDREFDKSYVSNFRSWAKCLCFFACSDIDLIFQQNQGTHPINCYFFG